LKPSDLASQAGSTSTAPPLNTPADLEAFAASL
jgi:hypothetical protein